MDLIDYVEQFPYAYLSSSIQEAIINLNLNTAYRDNTRLHALLFLWIVHLTFAVNWKVTLEYESNNIFDREMKRQQSQRLFK